jgi:hypothetical protein
MEPFCLLLSCSAITSLLPSYKAPQRAAQLLIAYFTAHSSNAWLTENKKGTGHLSQINVAIGSAKSGNGFKHGV